MTTTGLIDMQAKRSTASKRIKASPEAIFDLLADPAKHGLFDGSGMVQGTSSTSQRLSMGSKFAMSMKFKFVPYRIGSTVVEFEENRLIAWQHFGKHRWRYELEPIDAETTLVTETFDWSTARSPKALETAGYPKANLASIEKTLERLAALVEGQALAAETE